jgi:predicted ATPase
MTESTARWRTGRLPAEPTRLIGRRREIAAARRVLRRSRLVTLTGVGGVGKSRVALRLATEAEPDFANGACLVELSAQRDVRLLAHTIATDLQVQDQTSRPMTEVLADFVSDKELLLVLDSCEPFVAECAELVTMLLQAAPRLRIVATSRQPLGVPAEHTLVIPPLSVPAGGDAVALFVDRAAAVVDGFTLTPEDEPTIIRLCERLDGIPLAIELAAVRLRTLSIEQILSRLDDRFQLLTDGDQAGVHRHQTLRVAIGWSHELCTPPERLLWSRLSIFPGSFDLNAVEDICTDLHLPGHDVFDVLARLVEKSVVQAERGAGGLRYRMLTTLSEYGRDWLRELGEEQALRRRHRDRYLRFAEQAEADWFGVDQAGTFRRTELERANLRAALEYSLTTPDEAQTGQRLAATLWYYWVGCGYVGEGRLWLDRALALDATPTEARAKAQWVAGYVAILQGDHPAGVRILRECIANSVFTKNAVALAYATHRLGCAALTFDDHPAAAELFTQALARYEALGVLNSNVVMARIELAMATAFQGDLAGAVRLCEEARQVCEDHGELWSRAYALYVLSFASWTGGDVPRAITLAKESLRITHMFHDMVGCVLSVELLALYRTVDADYADAAALQGSAQPIWRSTGLRLFGSKYFNAPHEECERRAREALGDAGYEAAFKRGTALPLDEAVAYALA